MTIIPNFLLKRMYRQGSLRRMAEGVGFDIVNNLGSGQISKLNSIILNQICYPPEEILLVSNGTTIPAKEITEDTPATFFLNQTITCVICHPALTDGAYEIKLDLISREAGKVTLTIQDTLTTHENQT